MAETPRQLVLLALSFALLAGLPTLATLLGKPDLVTLATQIAIYAIAAVSLDLLVGQGGMVSFGHAGFFGLGGYVVGIIAFHAADGALPPELTQAWIAWPAAMLIAGLAALAIGALSLRTTGVSFIMITLAFAEMIFFLFVALKTYGGDDGLGFRRRNAIPGLNPRDDVAFYYVCLALMVAWLLLCRRLIASRFGMALAGIRQNERRMAAIGLSPYRVKLAAFTLAGTGAGLAGALQANLLRFVSPEMLHWTTSGDLLVMVVLGGMGTLYGGVFGAAAFVGLHSALSQYTEHWMIILGPILVAVALLAKRGIWGALRG